MNLNLLTSPYLFLTSIFWPIQIRADVKKVKKVKFFERGEWESEYNGQIVSFRNAIGHL